MELKEVLSYLNLKSILERKDWTRAAITKFLGEADDYRQNPMYKSAAPQQLYLVSRVEAAETTEEFRAWVEKSKVRRASSKGAAEVRRQETVDAAKAIVVEVPTFDLEQLIRKACASYNQLNSYRDGFVAATPNSSPEFLDRIAVNYLRHQMTDYEELLDRQFGKVGTAEAKEVIREKVYDAIGDTYPSLADECFSQQRRRDEQAAMRDGWR